MNVKGLKITDILNIDLNTFNHLTESELKQLTNRLVSATNKRIKRLHEHNINSPAVQSLGDVKKFTAKLPSDISKQQRVNAMREKFAKARSFLTNQTSSVRGYQKYVKYTKERIASELGMSTKTLEERVNIGRLFDLLHKAQNDGLVSSYRGSQSSAQARNMIAEILVDNPSATDEDIMTYLENQMEDWYEEKEELEDYDDETDEFEW